MTEEQKTANPDELVTPEEHAETTETVEPDQHISDPEVPNDVEIAARMADNDEPSDVTTKVFVLGPSPLGGTRNPYTEANGYDHGPNKAATRQYAIDAGLWPTADVEFKSAKRHPDGESWILTYTVAVIPANDAPDGSQTPSVSTVSFPEVDDDGEPTGKATVEDALNYSPPEDVAEHGAQGDDTTTD